MKNVVILLTCFNRKEKTLACIHSLVRGNPTLSLRFIVADDASTDGTAAALRELEQVTVLELPGNQYYTGGMRAAIDYALRQSPPADNYVLVNDDVVFDDRALEKMALLAPDDETVLVGAMRDAQGKLSYSGVTCRNWRRPHYDRVAPQAGVLLPCDTFCANCVWIPQKVFFAAGNMDSHYVHAMGDYDYGLAIRRKGFALRVAPETIGVCNNNPTHGTWKDPSLPRRRRLRLKESPKGLPFSQWFYYLRKNHGLVCALLYSATPYARILFGK